MQRVRLRSDVHIGVDYADRTVFGSPVSRRLEPAVRELYAPLVAHAEEHGFPSLVAAAPALLRAFVQGDAFARVAAVDVAGGWQLRPEVLYPDPTRARPAQLLLFRAATGRQVDATLPPAYWPGAHALIAALNGDGYARDDALHPDLRAMLEAMEREGLLEAAEPA